MSAGPIFLPVLLAPTTHKKANQKVQYPVVIVTVMWWAGGSAGGVVSKHPLLSDRLYLAQSLPP